MPAAARGGVALVVFVGLFALVSGVGFAAGRWRRGDLALLEEWGLAGRRLGTVVSWFLIGGDLYTAYTLIAVPAALYGQGALGFFAVPYTVLAYPIMFVIMPRLWNVAKRHDLVTPADFVAVRYGSDVLALAVAATGILATLPYIALQLVGMQVVIAGLGIGGRGLAADLPLAIAFAILAAFTYTSGLRAPALIAIVKDAMVYAVVVAAVVAIPVQLGGFGHVFAAASAHFTAAAAAARVSAATPASAAAADTILGSQAYWGYATLALGSALALFLYPHAVTGILGASRAAVVRRNAVLLPAYSLLLGFLALLGYAALAAHVVVGTPSEAVPQLFRALFPAWFVGFAFAAIAIGALVPAAVMSIAAANLWTRNVYKPYVKPTASAADEAGTAKLVSLVVKLGALAFVLGVPSRYAIDLQLLGGMWILQTLPAVVAGLYTRWFHHLALLWGWLTGMLVGTVLAFSQGVKPTFPVRLGGVTIAPYIGLDALAVNLVASTLLTVAFDRARAARGLDATHAEDYRDGPVAPAGTTLLGTTA